MTLKILSIHSSGKYTVFAFDDVASMRRANPLIKLGHYTKLESPQRTIAETHGCKFVCHVALRGAVKIDEYPKRMEVRHMGAGI